MNPQIAPLGFTLQLAIVAMVVIHQTAFAQQEPSQNGKPSIGLAQAKQIMQKIDKDSNGTFEKSEDDRTWKRYRQLDSNKDQVLSIEELSELRPEYLETGGLRKLDLVYKTIDERELLLDLYYPTGGTKAAGSPPPVVVYTHGGGWAAGSKHGIAKSSFKVVFLDLLEQGFAVASVNYRLCKKNSSVTMRDCVVDSKDAIRFLAKNSESLKLNPQRFFVMGDSAGGHIAQMLLLTPPEALPGDKSLASTAYRVLGGVSWYGPCDFENIDLFNHDDRADFRDRFAARILGANFDPAAKQERYREISPVNYLNANSPPLLMIQGNQDTTIPVKHAHFMSQKATAVKAPVEILIVKNAGHNWRQVGNEISPSRAEIEQSTVKFLVDHLQPDAKEEFSPTSDQQATAISQASEGEKPRPEYPEFTWDRIPRYMHIRKAQSFTEEEIKFLARFPLITFEKANGHQDHGSVEAGTLKAARAVKAINPDTTILYYRNVMVHYGSYAANKGLAANPRSDCCTDQKGNSKLVRNRVEAYDLSNADLRTWWANSCSSMTADPHIDGIFLDGNIKALERGYLARQIGDAKKQQTMDGYHLMMKQTREAIGPDKLMIANILRARFENAGLEYLDYFDGSYLEGFFHNVGGASYEEYVAKGIDAMQKAARQGKIIAFTTGFAASKNTSVMGIDEGHATIGSDAQARARH